ncbi:23S rRNA (adenine(2030)-N(6))-methyltransferase RlmJ [Roseobacter sp. HKCCA0434]|uniref:23S rRNA (adenine(2030)-N(6))-methyltransferase RlmJ n=1 Tax=Roseobacter sp. HKCCA0434 TaxID=3079297 RepID=UPI002905EFD6|nr:23S rRNA (adenine(2030)-N(6))-methyltransferase RlmJ [Roseobacter sp. HKCCA0434]
MLSYQHAYHAGGPADVHKHVALVRVLAALTAKPRGITYMETHSGRGLYDLSSDESRKTGEAAEGIAMGAPEGERFSDLLAELRAGAGPDAYPGSPLLAAMMLRDVDEMHLMELHPAEHAALRDVLPGADIHRRDGYEGVLALSPPTPRRGLVLVDPSYEVKSEYAQAGAFVAKLMAKWPEACVLVWYPILRAGRHADLLDALAPLSPVVDEVRFDLKGGAGMLGSGMVGVNLPHGVALG